MNKEYAIRPAQQKDIPAMVLLLEELFSLEEDFTSHAVKQSVGLRLLLLDSKSQMYVAERQGCVVGMCTGQLHISTAEGGLSVLIEDVVVLQEHRNKGIGRKLMQAITAWASAHKARRVQLLTDKSNGNAIEFYKHIGWGSTNLLCFMRGIEEEI